MQGPSGGAQRSNFRCTIQASLALSCALALSLVGCDGEDPMADASTVPDAGTPRLDAGESADAGAPPSDAGGSLDAGQPPGDAGERPDAGEPPSDAGPVLHHVEIRLLGEGAGAVAGGPFACDRSVEAVCVAEVAEGTALHLEATAEEGSVLEAWGADGASCGGELGCDRTIHADATFAVTFARGEVTLDLTLTGPGEVTLSEGDPCDASCTRTYLHGDVIAVTALPDADARLAAWTDACAGTIGSTCVLTLEADTTAGVGFATRHDGVAVIPAGTGEGRVTSSPEGIDCGADCAEDYPRGSSVTLSAEASVGSDFEGWSGDCGGSEADCVLAIDGPRTAVASFRQRRYALEVARLGDGEGTVGADEGGIACGADCAGEYGHGEVITLRAAPSPSSTFEGWGDACASQGTLLTCTVTMDAARSVSASFALRRHNLVVEPLGDGVGTVTSSPGGIACGADCAQIYDHGTSVTLTASAETASSRFVGWGGACEAFDDQASCALELDMAHTATATFERLPRTLSIDLVLSGGATATLTSDDGGIDCGADCDEVYPHGAVVELSALLGVDARLVSWGTSACPDAAPCSLVMDRDRALRVEVRGFEPTRFSDLDRDPLIRLREDRLAVDFHTQGGVRSDRAVAPGSGVFYFEARRLTAALGPYGVGVATASVPAIGSYVGQGDQSFGLNVDGGMTYDSAWAGNFDASNDTYGFVVDYRGATPTVHLIVEIGGVPSIRRTQAMPGVTTPLYIFAAGQKRTIGHHLELNPGNDTVNLPFTYDAEAVLRGAGRDAEADALVLGWGQTFAGAPDETTVFDTSADQTVAPGTPVTVTASAIDAEDGDLTAQIQWELLSSPHYAGRVRGTGGSFSFTPTAVGRHPARARVIDSAGQWSEAIVMITVSGPITQHADPRLVPDPLTGAGIQLRADARAARWTGGGKMGIRANQSIYGQFWYFEITRLVAPVNQGGGLMIAAGDLNPYDWADVAPSMSINTSGGVWRNIIWQANFPSLDATTYATYGFAVDYRGVHPRVYVILAGQVVRELVLDDVWVELHPVIYGNPTGLTSPGQYDEAINLRESAFVHDATAALSAYGVDTSGFSPWWGDANAP